MVPAFRSPRIVIGVVAILQICSGVALTFFYHEYFKALLIPRPATLIAFQVWGAMGIVFGVGMLIMLGRPVRHRAALRLIAACKLAAGATCIAVTTVHGLNASFALTGCLVELAPAALLACAHFEQSTLKNSTIGYRLLRWIESRYTLIAPLGVLFFLALGILSYPLLEWGRNRGLIAIATREVSEFKLKDAVWKKIPSDFPITPGTGSHYSLALAFDGMKFTDPVNLIEIPDGSKRFLVAERTGKIVIISGGERSTFLDWRAIVRFGQYSPEEGLLNMVLHPGYADPNSKGFRSIFIYFTRLFERKMCNCVYRFRVNDAGDAVDVSSEQLIFAQSYEIEVHHGGGLAFGPDGFLYIGVGDGFWGAPNLHAQKIDGGFFSGILRIDVDQQGGNVSHPIRRAPADGVSANYFVPNDNPFLSEDGSHLEEFYAIGFRNPWRISFDRANGQLYVADSGFEHREEINRVSKGDNGGWSYLEGTVPTQSINAEHLPRPAKLIGREIAPLYEYPRSVSFCTVGGYVYRGAALTDLQGKYVFGDVSGQLAAIEFATDDGTVQRTSIATAPQPLMALCSLAEDAQGELYVLVTKAIQKEEGVIYKLIPGPVKATALLPRKLSDTRLFSDLKTLTPHPSLTAYEINAPFWSDHAIKTRYVGTQSGLPLRGEPGNAFKIPTGTIFVKHFDFPTDLRNPNQTRRLETRILVFTLDNSWYGVTYRWNSEGTDAELIDGEQSERLQVRQLDGSVKEQIWQYPDRQACLACHNAVSEGALGFSYRQLWRKLGAAPVGAREKSPVVNQLERLRDLGILSAEALACNPDDLSRLAAIDDASRPLEDRARSYLDANCSYCHRNGVWYSTFDLRYDTPLVQTQLFTEPLLKNFTEWTKGRPVSNSNQAMAITAGAPEDSFLHRRMNTTQEGRRMPPLGRTVVDEAGVQVVRDWIMSMNQTAPTKSGVTNTATRSESSQDPVPR